MSFFDMDQPLGQQFYESPYEYFQTFVRNMNNQVFLSEYQLGILYSMLLLKRQSPWDHIKPNTEHIKVEIEQIVNRKLGQVKKILQGLSQVYESKMKKNTFSQIQRLMSIIKAKNKSIFIEKDMQFLHRLHMRRQEQQRKIQNQIKEKLDEPSSLVEIQNQKKTNQQTIQQHEHDHHHEQNTQKDHQNQTNNNNEFEDNQLMGHVNGDQRQVLSLFYGLSNLPNLSTLAFSKRIYQFLGNCLEYSSSERYIKFKMSRNYIMTIKNEDQMYFDKQSTLRDVSSDLYNHHIFPYLTAVELFKARGVCKQWMENVKEAWHSTFKRQMFVQLMACEFCKEIDFYYKMIQLRNPFFQKISLLMHALLQIIQWDKVIESIQNNSITLLLKRVLIILLKLLGEQITITNPNSITEEIWNQNKQKIITIKQRISTYLNNMNSTVLSVNDLMQIKVNLLDDPFIRVEEVSNEDKTPLLLVIFIKQLTLQQILKNHIFFSQEYLMNTKRRLDNVSSKMPQQKGFLQGVYKVLLLKSITPNIKDQGVEQKGELPNFQDLISSIFSNSEQSRPDFVIKNKTSSTSIFLDKATKLDIIVSTMRKIKDVNCEEQQKQSCQKKQQQIIESEQNIEKEHKRQLQTVNIYNINLNNDNNNNKRQERKKCDFQQNIYEEQIIEEKRKKQQEKEQK